MSGSLYWEKKKKKPYSTQFSAVTTHVPLSPLEVFGGSLFCVNASDLLPHFLVERTQGESSGRSADGASLTSIPSSVDIAAHWRALCAVPPHGGETEGRCGGFTGWNLPLSDDSLGATLWVYVGSPLARRLLDLRGIASRAPLIRRYV